MLESNKNIDITESISNENFCFDQYKQGYTVLKPSFNDEYHKQNGVVITTYYYFTNITRPEILRDKIKLFCQQHGILGTILLGTEGINSTICGSRQAIDEYYKFLRSIDEFNGNRPIEFKETFFNKSPFGKLKVRVKNEIVTFGGVCTKFDPGNYIEPEDWDEFIKRDDVILVDTRNDYEYDIGTFEGAINPKIDNFKQFAQWMEDNKELVKDKKFAMFCTGGIRCERSTSYSNQMGLNNVYHLNGGIIGYFIKTKNKNKAWIGKCFIFDDRIVMSPDLID